MKCVCSFQTWNRFIRHSLCDVWCTVSCSFQINCFWSMQANCVMILSCWSNNLHTENFPNKPIAFLKFQIFFSHSAEECVNASKWYHNRWWFMLPGSMNLRRTKSTHNIKWVEACSELSNFNEKRLVCHGIKRMAKLFLILRNWNGIVWQKFRQIFAHKSRPFDAICAKKMELTEIVAIVSCNSTLSKWKSQ